MRSFVTIKSSHLVYTSNLFHHVKRTDNLAKLISKIDPSCVYDFCIHFYSLNPRERDAHYRPQDTFRSLLVMYLAGFTSINKLVKQIKDTPLASVPNNM